MGLNHHHYDLVTLSRKIIVNDILEFFLSNKLVRFKFTPWRDNEVDVSDERANTRNVIFVILSENDNDGVTIEMSSS